MQEQGEQFLTAAEVAALFRCKPITVVRQCRSGRIPATKPLGTWLIPQSWVDQAVRESYNIADAEDVA